MADSESKSKRVVRFLSVDYFDPGVDSLTGEKVRRILSARRGDEIELVADEEERLDGLGALLDKGANREDAQAEQDALLDAFRAERGDTDAMQRVGDRGQRLLEDARRRAPKDTSGGIVDDSDVGDLAARIRDRKMTADDTVALAGNDSEAAKRVLEAERLASGGKPRPAVEAQLQKLIDGG